MVGPVDVLERQDERLLAGTRLHRRAHRREERLAQLLRVLELHRSGVLRHVDPEQPGHQRGTPLDGLALVLVVAEQQAARVVLDLLPGLVGVVLVADPRVGADHLAEGPVHDAGAIREAAALAERGSRLGALLDALAELLQQARLPDPRLADERDEVGSALARHAAVERLHQRQLVVAADQRRRGACTDAARGLCGHEPYGLPRGHGLGLALQMQGLEGAVLDLVGGRAVGALADGHAAGASGCLQARRDVNGVADHRVAVADRSRQDLAGVDAHAQLEARPVSPGQLDVDLVHRALHAERGADGALLVVLVGDGRAEDRHHVVADVLVHGAAIARDLFAEALEGTVDQRLDALGVHPLRDGRVARQVGKEDGHLPPLVRGRGTSRGWGGGGCRDRSPAGIEGRPAGHAELGRGRGGRAARRAAALELRAT